MWTAVGNLGGGAQSADEAGTELDRGVFADDYVVGGADVCR